MRSISENHKSIWHSIPFLRILLAMIAGIVAQYYLKMPVWFAATLFFTSVALILIIRRLNIFAKQRFTFYRNIGLQLLAVSAGMLLVWRSDTRNYSSWYGNNSYSNLVLNITEPPVTKAKSIKTESSVEVILDSNGNSHYASGKVLVYFAITEKSQSLVYGNRILVKTKPQKITGSGNPGAFNYSEYAAMQGFYDQLFLKDSDYVVLPGLQTSFLSQVIFQSRAFVLSVLKKYIKNDAQVLGVAEALLIGYKEHLDKEIVQAYTNTGVVHIIAISGLHLGLIYMGLVWITERIKFLKKLPWLKVLLIFFCLWFFSLLTGAPASVQRSAVMFSCILFGKYFFRQTKIWNSLAASSFLLLWFNPYLLWDVGFQLSYLAVGGIVLLQPFFDHILYLPSRNIKKPVNWPYIIMRGIWQLLTASLSAQLFTMPLALYYFHQMPVYFLFTNIVAVPVSTFILYAELFLLLLSPLPILASFVGKVVTAVIEFLNAFITFFNDLPLATVENIYANLLTTGVLYLALFFLVKALVVHKLRPLYYGLLTLFVFSGLQLFYKMQAWQQQRIVVYNVSGMQAIDFIDNTYYSFWGDDALRRPGLQQNFHLKPTRIYYQAYDSLPNLTLQSGNFIQFKNQKLFLAGSGLWYPELQEPVAVQMAVVSNNRSLKLKYLVQAVKPAIVIFDGTCSRFKIAEWKKECDSLNLRCYSVQDSGAFVLNIP